MAQGGLGRRPVAFAAVPARFRAAVSRKPSVLSHGIGGFFLRLAGKTRSSRRRQTISLMLNHLRCGQEEISPKHRQL